MNWKKLGLIFDGNYECKKFGQLSCPFVPTALQVDENIFDIYLGLRNKALESRIYKVKLNIENKKIVSSPSFLMDIGALGTFSDSGVYASSIVQANDKVYLYYGGVSLPQKIPFSSGIGLAEITQHDEVVNLFAGPVIGLSPKEALFSASCFIMHDHEIFKAWYTSGERWIYENDNLKHYYHIKYAESTDGISWKQNGQVAIDFKNEFEYAIARPCLVKDGNLYKMWYSYRASSQTPTYRIGYAESLDGITWERKDELAGIDVSETGWDSEMICYPYVFDHKGERYMLYNGNGYGRTGFGIAILEKE